MSYAILPFIPSNAEYDFDVPLNDGTYHFDVRWNSFEQAWYISISDSDLTPIVVNAKLVNGTYIGRRSTHDLFSLGAFAVIDTKGKYRDPSFDNLGTEVEVRYYSKRAIVEEIYGA